VPCLHVTVFSRTVAERYLPLPLPHSLPITDFGIFFFLAAGAAARAPSSGAHCDRAI
jgi:hypothetical protein